MNDKIKIVLTSGRGFIGSSLLEGMSLDHRVIAFTREMVNLEHPRMVEAALRKHRPDVVIHTAHADGKKPWSTGMSKHDAMEKNLRMFMSVVKAEKQYGRLIYFGSGAEYNQAAWKPRINEDDDTLLPNDEYGLGKMVATMIGHGANRATNLRLFTVVGKHADYRYRLINNLCARAVHGFPLHVKQNVEADYMDVRDLITAIEAVIPLSCPKRVYNVCSGQLHTSAHIANEVKRISGADVPITCPDRISKSYGGDNTRISQLMPGHSFIQLETMIRSVYDWYTENKLFICAREAIRWS
jgi:GDP-L-fucose synthase